MEIEKAIAHGPTENKKIFFRCFTFCAICTISVRVDWSSIKLIQQLNFNYLALQINGIMSSVLTGTILCTM